MSSRRNIPESVQSLVRERANELCEYCHTNEKWQYVRFTIDHIIPLREGGTDDDDNLALACFHCNRYKSNHIVGVDPETGLACSFFNPRLSIWNEHFVWSASATEIIGLTPVGRATVDQLQLNRPQIVNIHMADVAVGRHPPSNDRILGS